jgi:hypothetical protein
MDPSPTQVLCQVPGESATPQYLPLSEVTRAVVKTAANPYVATIADETILCCGLSNQVVTLPTGPGVPVGKTFTIKVVGAGVPVNVWAAPDPAGDNVPIDEWQVAWPNGGNFQLWNAPSTTQNGSAVTLRWAGRYVYDGVMSSTAAQTHLKSASAAFTADDVGSVVRVAGAGAGGIDLMATISSLVSATEVVLGGSCATTVAAARVSVGAQYWVVGKV